jgi:hypothetical protein
MSVRNNILKQLKTDLSKIKTSRDYLTDPAEVRRGIHMWEDFTIKPAISFWCYKDQKFEGTIRELFIYVYMYTDTDGLEDVDNIHNLADDVESFLYSSDHTYTDSTEVGDVVIYEGGIQDMASMAQLEITIKYSYGDNLV